MINSHWHRPARLWMGALVLFGLALSCDGSENVSPSAETPQAGDSLANPADAPPVPNDSLLIDSTGTVPQGSLAATGIPFGAMNMRAKYMNSMYNGTQRGIDPPYLMAELQLARSKGARIVLKMAGKQDDLIQNANGTFSLDKWKGQVNRYKGLNIGPYISDGTLIGHFLID